VLSRPSLIARTIIFIPDYPASSASKKENLPQHSQHCVADPEPDDPEKKEK
jgi:hypothetical protein